MPNIPPFIPRRSLAFEQLPGQLSSIGLLSMMGGGIIIITLLFSAGAFFLRTFQERQIEALRGRLYALIDELDPATIHVMDTFDKKLALAATILDDHAYTSRIFVFLSQTTLKDVRLNSFAFSAKEDTIALTTEAKGYTAFIKQLNFFRAQSSIKNVDAGSVSLGPAGTVRATITLKVAPSLLRL